MEGEEKRMDEIRQRLNIDLVLLIGFVIASHLDSKLAALIFAVLVLYNIYIIIKDNRIDMIKEYYSKNKTYILSIIMFIILPFVAIILHGLPFAEISLWLSQLRNEIIGIVLPFILLKNRVKMVYIFLTTVCMVNIAMFYGYFKYYIIGFDRLSSFITNNPNVYSTYLLILFCVVCYTMFYINQYKYILAFTLVNIFVSLVIANSRGCILLFFIGMLFAAVILLKNSLRHLVAFIIFIIVCFGGIYSLSPAFQNRIDNTLSSAKFDNERFIIYNTAINIIEENPMVGIGMGNFKKQYEEHNEYKDINNKVFYHVHQIILEMMVESGIFGLVAFICFIFGQFKVYVKGYLENRYNTIKRYAALMCLFITGLVFAYMQVENTYFALRKIYWIYIGIGYYLLINPDQMLKNKEY